MWTAFIVILAVLFLALVVWSANGGNLSEFFDTLGKTVLIVCASIAGVFTVGFLWVLGIVASLAIPIAFVAGCLLLVKWIFF
jgi:hypothetical protein